MQNIFHFREKPSQNISHFREKPAQNISHFRENELLYIIENAYLRHLFSLQGGNMVFKRKIYSTLYDRAFVPTTEGRV